jgi:membrane-bound lytic murein transglycosylase MltF
MTARPRNAAIALALGDAGQVTEWFSPDDQHSSLVNQHGRFWLNAQTHAVIARFFDDQRHSGRQPQLLLKCRWYQDMALIV